MPALQQRNRLYPFPDHRTNSTSPGVAQVRMLPNRTGLGPSQEAFLDTWEQQRFVLEQQKYLDLTAPASYRGSGCCFVVFVMKPEARSVELPEEPAIVFSAVEEQIATLKSSLSLQVKEIAELLGVERPTIYSWMNSRNTPRPASRDRLFALYELAKQWNRLSRTPLASALHESDQEGRTIFGMLRTSRLPKKQILDRFAAIAETKKSTDDQPSPRRSRLTLRDLAKKHGMDFDGVSDQELQLDLETGKRISPE